MGWYFFIFTFSLLAIMVTDTVFRKSSLGKLFLEKIVPGTSKNWPYHNLLVFCLKFKLSPVCEYLNYYYNVIGLFQKNSNRGDLGHTFFFKKIWIWIF